MMTKTARDNLLKIVAAYCKATGQSITTVSRDVYGRGNYLTNLRRSKRFTLSIVKLDEMVGKLRKQWPAGAKWPEVKPLSMGHDPRD